MGARLVLCIVCMDWAFPVCNVWIISEALGLDCSISALSWWAKTPGEFYSTIYKGFRYNFLRIFFHVTQSCFYVCKPVLSILKYYSFLQLILVYGLYYIPIELYSLF